MDGSHLWLAHTLLGESSPVNTLQDMIGSFSLKANKAVMTTAGFPPMINLKSGDETPILNVSTPIPEERTLLVVAKVEKKGDSFTVIVPGIGLNIFENVTYVVNSGGRNFGFYNDGFSGAAVNCFVVRLSAQGVNVWGNNKLLRAGNESSAPAPVNRWSIGSSAPYSGGAYSESFGVVKVWDRALTDQEIKEASNDAMKLFTIL